MLRFSNLKLYRKFLILAVMLTSLFILSSANRVGATQCCDYCQILYESCMRHCDTVEPENYESCSFYGCEVDYLQCGSFCYSDFGGWGCTHP
jgi:hypothetical protein